MKECPFCGGKADNVCQFDEITVLYSVYCPDCGCSTDVYPSMKEAIDAWNKRARDTNVRTEERTCYRNMDTDYYSGKLDKFSCSYCGITWAIDDGMTQTTKVSYCPSCGAKVVD